MLLRGVLLDFSYGILKPVRRRQNATATWAGFTVSSFLLTAHCWCPLLMTRLSGWASFVPFVPEVDINGVIFRTVLTCHHNTCSHACLAMGDRQSSHLVCCGSEEGLRCPVFTERHYSSGSRQQKPTTGTAYSVLFRVVLRLQKIILKLFI